MEFRDLKQQYQVLKEKMDKAVLEVMADCNFINGRQVKASYQVKVGDIIEVAFGQRSLKVEVLAVSETVKKEDAPAMYRELE